MTVVIYGSTTGNTQTAAEKIAEALGDARVCSAAEAKPEDLDQADLIVLGTSTWGCGDLQDDWEENIALLDQTDFSGKKAALFALGDQESYPDTFVDGMGVLRDRLESNNAVITGSWPVEGYEFDESAAVRDGRFAGLVLDEDNQADLTDNRIREWVNTL